MLRREVASRCLFGVDLNPMAVQLARLSLWLATLATDKPLSFLDHHLVAGNSLVGASPDDLRRQPGGGAARGRRHEELPLFQTNESRRPSSSTRSGSGCASRWNRTTPRRSCARRSGRWPRCTARSRRSADVVAAPRPVVRRLVLEHTARRPTAARFASSRRGCSTAARRLPERTCSPLLTALPTTIAARIRFLHWPLAFPEVFLDEQRPGPRRRRVRRGHRQPAMGHGPRRQRRRAVREPDGRRTRVGSPTSSASPASTASRARAHANLYQLFVERALQLVRPGGRIGLVLPSGVVSDAGAAPLRRHLFDRADVDAITGLDNREAIFPIHRSTRFVLLTCTPGRPTRRDPLPIRDHSHSRISSAATTRGTSRSR